MTIDKNPALFNQSLYALNAEYQAYLATIEAARGEVSEDSERALKGAETALARKVEACDFVLSRLASEAAFYKARIAQMQDFMRAFENAGDRLLERLGEVLRETPGEMLEGETVAYKLVTSPGSVEVSVESEIPDAYKKTVITHQVEKARIKEDIKAGIEVPGARLVFHKYPKRTRPRK